MKQLLGFALLVHAGYSLSNYRKYLISSDSTVEYSIPLDVSKLINFYYIIFIIIWKK